MPVALKVYWALMKVVVVPAVLAVGLLTAIQVQRPILCSRLWQGASSCMAKVVLNTAMNAYIDSGQFKLVPSHHI